MGYIFPNNFNRESRSSTESNTYRHNIFIFMRTLNKINGNSYSTNKQSRFSILRYPNRRRHCRRFIRRRRPAFVHCHPNFVIFFAGVVPLSSFFFIDVLLWFTVVGMARFAISGTVQYVERILFPLSIDCRKIRICARISGCDPRYCACFGLVESRTVFSREDNVVLRLLVFGVAGATEVQLRSLLAVQMPRFAPNYSFADVWLEIGNDVDDIGGQV